MSISSLPPDLWYDVFGLLDIDEAIAVSQASPRLFGAFILSKQGIRFRNAINSFMRSTAVDLPVGPLSSFVCSVLRDSFLEFSALISWLAIRFQPVISSSIVLNRKVFKDLSSTIALKDRFVSVSSSVNDWTVKLNAIDGSVSSVSWILLYRASLSEYEAADFHHACDGMEKCVVVVKAENGRIASAYNEDGFASVAIGRSPSLNGFIATAADDGGCGEVFHRTDHEAGVWNYPGSGPWFGSGSGDLFISANCHLGELSHSNLGGSYGTVPDINQYALFGQEDFQVVDYEVFKIVIE
jgi:hypothetical protein